jgi:hypothetical protein
MVDQSIDEYALGILESSQRAAIDRHLSGCPTCATLMSGYEQTVAVLALAVPLAQPSATARTALFARIATTSQTIAPARSVYTGDLDALRTPTLPPSTTLVPSMPEKPQPSSAWWRVYAAPLATLPLLLALGLVAAWGVNNYAQLNDKNVALAEKDMQIAALLNNVVDGDGADVANIVTDPSTKRYALSPEVGGADVSAQGMLYAVADNGTSFLKVSGLPQGTYAVVVQEQDGSMVPTTEFSVGADGTASSFVQLGTNVTDLRSVHIRPTTVTIESDVANVGMQPDALMTVIGPDISDDADTSVMKP